jgi:hypothetical protein
LAHSVRAVGGRGAVGRRRLRWMFLFGDIRISVMQSSEGTGSQRFR